MRILADKTCCDSNFYMPTMLFYERAFCCMTEVLNLFRNVFHLMFCIMRSLFEEHFTAHLYLSGIVTNTKLVWFLFKSIIMLGLVGGFPSSIFTTCNLSYRRPRRRRCRLCGRSSFVSDRWLSPHISRPVSH